VVDTAHQNILILDRYTDIAPLVADVNRAADSDKSALGFFPASVYTEFARKEQLLVAVHRHETVDQYAGHLLYDARHPKAHVRQMFVAPAFRKRGVATRLLDHLKRHLTDRAFISMYARVAEDLDEANRFWQKQDFYVQRATAGGASRNRSILVRTHELDTPQLFATSKITGANLLGLDFSPGAEVPLFLLDLNVLFDLGPRRLRNKEVLDLFQVERMGACRLALSTEIKAELERTAVAGRTDPMQAYARIFPAFETPPDAEWDALASKLASIVFPERHNNGILSKNDISDLRHLATAIHHRLTGLVTNDASILCAAAPLKDQFDIQVISPIAFQEFNTPRTGEEAYETASSDTIVLTSLSGADEPAVRHLLSRLDVPVSTIASRWAGVDTNEQVCVRHGVWKDEMLIGYLMWPKSMPGNCVRARIAVDETQNGGLNAARALLRHLIEQVSPARAAQVSLEFPPRQAQVREVASGLGFGGTETETSLSKAILGRVVTEANWSECKRELFEVSQLRLPESPPQFRSVDQQLRLVRPDGNPVHVSLMTLETLLAPALFSLKGRAAVITPVRRDFAEHLLMHLPQKSLLPHPRAALYSERHYLSGKQTLKHFARGTLVLFYESSGAGGLGAIVALARVQHAYLKSQQAMEKTDLDPSVLDADGLEAIGRSEIKTVMVFDNLICLDRPVDRVKLQSLRCGNPNQLITTRKIDDAQLQEILAEGFAHG
jgi:GNAT superfamily N-acetyltransferase/predicted nucleic acid-binding protein